MAKTMAQKSLWLSSFCYWLPGKIPGICSQEILYFIQPLMKGGKNGVGIEITGPPISESVQFPVSLSVQPHKDET